MRAPTVAPAQAGRPGRARAGSWSRRVAAGLAAAGLAGALGAGPARAAPAAVHGLPPAYGAVVLAPPTLPASLQFDLGPVAERARREGKRLYIYMGADDCAYCRRYEAFLAANVQALKPHFADWLIVDLRSSLKVPVREITFKSPLGVLTYTDFQRALGDERHRQLVYPTVWLLDASLKPLMQMPAGAGTFQTVPEQIEVLQLVQ